MNYFCSAAEFDAYVESMELDKEMVLKLTVKEAMKEVMATFSC